MIAYLINQYPQSSQSFIRREILAVEKLRGRAVERFSVRRWNVQLVDEGDRAEQARTRVVLDAGGLGLLSATLKALFTRPAKFFSALRLALKVGRRSHRGPLYHLVYLAEACVLLGWLRERGVTHVHAHFGTNSTTVAMLVRALGGPRYSFTVHGPEEFDAPEFLALGEKVRRSDFAVVISEYGKSQLCRWSDVRDWDKIKVVHCGLDGQFLDVAKVPPPAAPRLVCVGRLGEQKGQLVLMEAAAKLARDGVEFELNLIGDGPMRPAIEATIAMHNLGGRVKLLGWKSNAEVAAEVQRSRALVLPSFAEGLPVVFMESLALERPVITTYIAGTPELVQHGVSGWLVPASSVDALAAAMREALATDPARLHEMGRAGAEIVRRNHTATTEAAKLLELFERP
ncbi:MAG TPA: glycosyltransferase [Tepidisphaeraceae bacterium]|nr:glycosyltransferase [Tepidisphaeraceae bacterium]